MLKNYWTITWRRLIRERQFTLLNLVGLSAGLTCTIPIFAWVSNETAMDRFHANNDRLYQVICHIQLPDGIHTQPYTPGLLADGLRRDMPEIQYAIAVQSTGPTDDLIIKGEHFKASADFVDADFFHVFSYKLLRGSIDQPFPDKNAVLISDETAKKCFHTTSNIIGKTIQWGEDSIPYHITGVFEHPGPRSSEQFDLLFSYSTWVDASSDRTSWLNSNPDTYFTIKPGTDVHQLAGKLRGYLQTKAKASPLTISIRKYADKYLYDTYENGVQAGGRIGYVRLFSAIAIFVLLIACINFMNLSTARATRRAKELGIKKVAGATRGQLIGQYLGESVLMAFLSLLLAIVGVFFLMPGFNAITGKTFQLSGNIGFWGTVTAIALLTGTISGSYPALYLSGFRPVMILKGKLPHSPGELFIRKGLVVFQFTLSMLFIVAVLVIYRQMKMVQTANLGYDKTHVISFANAGQLEKSFRPFVSDLQHIPGVTSTGTIDGDMTGHTSGNTEKVTWEGEQSGQAQLFMALDVDYSAMNLLGIPILQGRGFSSDYPSDSASSIILNETAVNAMGLKDPIGKTFRAWGTLYHIIGVAKDFHFQSLYEKIRPCMIRLRQNGATVFVRIAPGQETAAIGAIGKLVRQYNPGMPFEYKFIDQAYEALYVSEQRIAILARYFAGLAILISCLGLFGLAAFTAGMRQKEIGIRKVIGATISTIVIMLSRDFIKLVALAMLIALPLSWWLMTRWLDNFAYHIPITPSLFLLSGASVLLITVLTIDYQSIRAAIINPITSLRTE